MIFCLNTLYFPLIRPPPPHTQPSSSCLSCLVAIPLFFSSHIFAPFRHHVVYCAILLWTQTLDRLEAPRSYVSHEYCHPTYLSHLYLAARGTINSTYCPDREGSTKERQPDQDISARQWQCTACFANSSFAEPCFAQHPRKTAGQAGD